MPKNILTSLKFAIRADKPITKTPIPVASIAPLSPLRLLLVNPTASPASLKV